MLAPGVQHGQLCLAVNAQFATLTVRTPRFAGYRPPAVGGGFIRIQRALGGPYAHYVVVHVGQVVVHQRIGVNCLPPPRQYPAWLVGRCRLRRWHIPAAGRTRLPPPPARHSAWHRAWSGPVLALGRAFCANTCSICCCCWLAQWVRSVCVIGLEQFQRVVFQDANLLLGVRQFALAEFQQLAATLVSAKRRFQRQLARFPYC